MHRVFGFHDPNRYDEYKHLTVKDIPFQKFLEEESTMADSLTHVFNLVLHSVEIYISRDFSHLCESFGCTSGRTHLVYAAERSAEYLKNNYSITVVLQHIE